MEYQKDFLCLVTQVGTELSLVLSLGMTARTYSPHSQARERTDLTINVKPIDGDQCCRASASAMVFISTEFLLQLHTI